ncbi:hypothetical protein EfmAA96_14520 [Enterococcus faecium]|nr:hypothetical protein EfmAA96_14520 [Enterococcus faecium]
MYIRQTRKEEVEEVVEIINAAADFIASQGSPQWQNGQKPTKETILNDIERKESYVLIVEDQIAGTAALVSSVDPTFFLAPCRSKLLGRYNETIRRYGHSSPNQNQYP